MDRSRHLSKSTTMMVWLDADESISDYPDLDAETFSDPVLAMREALDLLEDPEISLKKRPVILYGTSSKPDGDITVFEAILKYAPLH